MTENNIAVTEEQRQTLKEGYSVVREYFQEIEAAKENIKDAVEALAEKTGLEKAQINKFFTVTYKGTPTKLEEEVELIKFLSE